MAVIKKKDIWLAGIYSSLMFAIITGFAGLWAIPFLQTKFDVSLTHAALASSMVFAGAGVGAVFFGWLSDKVGLRCLPMQLGALGVFAILVILIYRPHLPFHACFILLLFLGFFSGTYAIPFALVRDLTPPAQQGTAMGFTNMMCIIIGAPILQPLLGWLLHLKNLDMNLSVQDFRICFMILPGLMIVAFAMALWIGETHCRETT